MVTMDRKINLCLGFHNHQPVGNFDFVFEEVYQKAYRPLLEVLLRHPAIKVTFHYTGVLLDWLQAKRPELLDMIREGAQKGQIELKTGGYYEPIHPIIPDDDKREQIWRMNETLGQLFGVRPRGMWLAERVWEPHLAKILAECGVEYVVVDDHHFKLVGLKDEDLRGYYITEEQGVTLKVFPIDMKLRYLVPFQSPAETLAYLRRVVQETVEGNACSENQEGRKRENGEDSESEGWGKEDRAVRGAGTRGLASVESLEREPLLVLDDDGEKLGAWPGTYEQVYERGWLEEFLSLLERESTWIRTVHFSEYLDRCPPLGRIYLPNAAYAEMLEWSGGFWRNFLIKYPESNNMHKKMLYVRDKVRRAGDKEAYRELLSAQCNDAYWHGVFGGLYLPHLRSAIFRHLIRAEVLAEKKLHQEKNFLFQEVVDLDRDGRPEVVISNACLNLYLDPAEGGTIFEIDYKPALHNLTDTLARRREAYHQKLLQLAGEGEGAEVEGAEVGPETTEGESGQEGKEGQASEGKEQVRTIHEIITVKEAGLDKFLFYDQCRNVCLRDHFLAPETGWEQFWRRAHHEEGAFWQKEYDFYIHELDREVVVSLSREGFLKKGGLEGEVCGPLLITKKIRLPEDGSAVHLEYELHNRSQRFLDTILGVEFHFALLSGYDVGGGAYFLPGRELEERQLASQGVEQEVEAVGVRSELLGLELELYLGQRAELWRFPIETVSQSEAGFERVYQSSCLVPRWKIELKPQELWRNQMRLEIKALGETGSKISDLKVWT